MSVMMYGAETRAAKKALEKKLDVAEMKMLRWICGVTKINSIRNERITGAQKYEKNPRKCMKEGMS